MTKDGTPETVVEKQVEEQTEENSEMGLIKSAEKIHNAEKAPGVENISVNHVLEKSYAEEAETLETNSCRFKCDECNYENNFEKGLKQHKRMKHKILQTDGIDDKELDEIEVSDISHLVVLRNWRKESNKEVHLLSEILLEPPAKVFCREKGVGVYEFTCCQGSFCYKFADGDIMEC